MEAFQVYPLINGCQVFLLCTGIAPEEEDLANGNLIPPEAVLEIGRGIYQNLQEPGNVPPLCILATKADLAAGKAEVGVEAENNPFRRVNCGEDYRYREELQNFSLLYDTTTDPDVREALNVCYTAYKDLSHFTYVSMMSCWALGRKALKKPDEMDIHDLRAYLDPATGRLSPFRRMRIDRLCRWIFQCIGILPVDGYAFPAIPSYGEGYVVEGSEGFKNLQAGTKTKGIRNVYLLSEACERIQAVRELFINCGENEPEIRNALEYWEENAHKRLWFGRKEAEQTVRELLKV